MVFVLVWQIGVFWGLVLCYLLCLVAGFCFDLSLVGAFTSLWCCGCYFGALRWGWIRAEFALGLFWIYCKTCLWFA